MAFKVNDSHWEIILSFLEEHKCLATGRNVGPNGRNKNKLLWAELSQKLNSLGYGERSPDKWQKTWTDLKYLVKKKASNVKLDIQKTGGGPPNEVPLNRFEKRVIEILGDSFFQGVGSEEVAVPSSSRVNTGPQDQDVPEYEPIYQDHDYNFQPPPKKRKNKINELNGQYKETIEILREIKDAVSKGLSDVAESLNNLAAAIRKD